MNKESINIVNELLTDCMAQLLYCDHKTVDDVFAGARNLLKLRDGLLSNSVALPKIVRFEVEALLLDEHYVRRVMETETPEFYGVYFRYKDKVGDLLAEPVIDLPTRAQADHFASALTKAIITTASADQPTNRPTDQPTN